ncbi:hypothetical protein ABFS82_10G154300 [Erythranthe guttata]|uniref:VQ domain-containing protein n=1 Tax=Erythranthe guttata TaxID=4155 RepID=A0A022PWL3_ERYGU|nr:hypothetical protein MIMGU_mgv1a015164mg [Erythranthe guttata]
MEKLLTVNQKSRANKQIFQTKTKKKQQPPPPQPQPLKVVYITNPIKINATASEFRALVQELTGQDADFSETARFAAAGAADKVEAVAPAAAAKVAAVKEESAHAVVEGVEKLGQTNSDDVERNGPGSDPLSTFGSYLDDVDDAFCTVKMIENYPTLMASSYLQWGL